MRLLIKEYVSKTMVKKKCKTCEITQEMSEKSKGLVCIDHVCEYE